MITDPGAPPKREDRTMKEMRVLVVDDEKSICDNARKILEKNDFEVTQAFSAKEALEKMAKESFALLISDIVMPDKNGLELLRMVKEQWPLTKVIIMTAYASTDTAVKAIRLGALDYIPKPFTPDEMRAVVGKAFSGELKEASSSDREKKAIDLIDLDVPFNRREVAAVTGEEYVDKLGPSDMPVVETPSLETLEHYCKTGEKICAIFKKLGNTCKAGLKANLCPQAKKGAKGKSAQKKDSKKLIGIDQPFNYEEVVSVTGPEYVIHMQGDGYSFLPYEELKERMAGMGRKRDVIDTDVPFQRKEVAKAAGEAYVDSLGPSDMPAAASPSPETLEHYCKTGEKVCDIFKKLGTTCKAGLKGGKCPQAKAKKKGSGKEAVQMRRMIGPDMPFDYEEVLAVTGPDYVRYVEQNGVARMPYEELKERMAKLMTEKEQKTVVRKPKGKAAPTDLLVIDDEVSVNNNILKILSKKGYSVDQAMTKEEALGRIEGRSYKVALLDLKMPGVKGLELLKAIREKRPETLVLIITGYASIESAVESARMGAIGYLPKPFTPDEIRKATEQALRLAA
jgi:DNA-binding response OmpR family regulator